jgi:RNA polymerase sigma factor (sigma-70 family)
VNTLSRPTEDDFAVLAQVIRGVTRSRRLSAADAQDFAQSVHLRLLERDYEVFRQFSARCSIRTYLNVVVTRLLLDWLNSRYGKWRPSALALRLGEPAVSIERLTDRDGHSPAEAIELLATRHGGWSLDELRRVAALLPRRVHRHFVSAEVIDWKGGVPFDDPVANAETTRAKAQIARALTRALRQLPTEERRLVVQRFARRRSVQALAAEMQMDPRLLYRRFDKTLRTLRRSLTAAGVTGVETVATPGYKLMHVD